MKKLDDILKEFDKRTKNAESSYKDLWKDMDEFYDVDIHIWRHKGMGNSLQTIAGNKISILTATASYLNTLLLKDVMTLNELDEMIKMVKENLNVK